MEVSFLLGNANHHIPVYGNIIGQLHFNVERLVCSRQKKSRSRKRSMKVRAGSIGLLILSNSFGEDLKDQSYRSSGHEQRVRLHHRFSLMFESIRKDGGSNHLMISTLLKLPFSMTKSSEIRTRPSTMRVSSSSVYRKSSTFRPLISGQSKHFLGQWTPDTSPHPYFDIAPDTSPPTPAP
ncbi:hypothetical protein OUZ56_029305 [Daphnia magna]|uniref:Uncharacterized protein n=1 Tax=Daphnia magna TaxID=35525 RepID=A0ABR0B6F6_9CRUS|nr:hypothetical protein OUZ56_029305 [Daphnia magna]